MANIKKRQPIKGTPPLEDEEFYVLWGRETLKNNLAFTNDVLRQLVTLNAVLLGGSIAFLDDSLVDSTFKKVIILLFFLSLVFSFVGMMPYGHSVDLRLPEDIRRHKEFAFKLKRYFLWTAGALLASGFIVALVGLIVHKA